SYRQTFETSQYAKTPPGADEGVNLEGARYTRSVLWGGMLNLNYKFRGLHKFSLKTNYNQTATDNINTPAGIGEDRQRVRRQTIEWNQRSFDLAQLTGEHKFPGLGGLHGEWRVYYSESRAQEPDRKFAEYEQGSGGWVLRTNYRSWS